ncbi:MULTISPECIES: helix-turn-helix transcriptional regulator [Brenneria]|uniref:AlpA family transcriptional regulator n=1 Tax=Brenneria nigrifluens DSM 30175 = ATCC 13028 TaxID=1121120 RepID=A0A2U1UQ37_9GAMM|nr:MULTISPECIES: AlpA family transcriptional regulator [Brenneria]EHD20707.1 phage transcriptional regulator, AlpA [Brenneria sp. EniD312]PWC23798.1 AlpA family transcriptional regulator [Brenneria nigrifluens DSM 30175 = ATCC 13028]QCR03882.1 AlpA family transcriptional regulator [Brenneria nigrifluens DSM 30175 = ATCC 13028]
MGAYLNKGKEIRLIRLKDVMAKTGLPRSTIYHRMKDGRFPLNVSIGERTVAWVEQEIIDWINSNLVNRKGVE